MVVLRAFKRWGAQVRYHRWSLLALGTSYLFAQLCTFAQTPITSIYDDTPSYVTVAQQLSQSSFREFPVSLIHHQPLRTPGYPLFLWVLQSLTGTPFANTACYPTSPSIAACNQAFIPFVIVQTALYGLTVLEVYVLVYWLTRKSWMAAVAAIIATCNFYMYSWERVISSDLLSMCAIVTVLLVARNIATGSSFDPWKVNTDAEYHEEARLDEEDRSGRLVPARVGALARVEK